MLRPDHSLSYQATAVVLPSIDRYDGFYPRNLLAQPPDFHGAAAILARNLQTVLCSEHCVYRSTRRELQGHHPTGLAIELAGPVFAERASRWQLRTPG